MPKYHAVGVSASLSVSNLQSSWSNVFDLRMSAEQRADAERIENGFATGRKLPESPIGSDGSAKGVVQFVGEHEDLPIFVVEAGEAVGKKQPDQDSVDEEEGVGCGGPVMAVVGMGMESTQDREDDVAEGDDAIMDAERMDIDSPLTSLTGTPSVVEAPSSLRRQDPPLSPTPATARKRTKGSKQPKKAHAVEQLSSELTSLSDLSHLRSFLDAPDGPQALCLTVEMGKCLLAKAGYDSRKTGRDLKLEVFLNGELVAGSLFNTRGVAVEVKNDKVRFHGTRIHRQSERPWTYQTSKASATQDETLAKERWDAISLGISREAHARGHNKWGDVPPSAEVLCALSKLDLPERLKQQHGLAVIDLVITAGTGKKYGPDTAYITKPIRMDDPRYKVSPNAGFSIRKDSSDPFTDDGEMLFGMTAVDVSPLRGLNFPALDNGRATTRHISPLRDMNLAAPSPHKAFQSSREVPLIRQRRSMTAAPETPTKRKALNARAPELELDLHGVNLNMRVTMFETARGGTSQQRTLKKRLSDIKQMNATNAAKAITALKLEMGEEKMHAINRALRLRAAEEAMLSSPSKRARLDDDLATQGMDWDALNMLADVALAGQDGTIDPQYTMWPAPVLDQSDAVGDVEMMEPGQRICMDSAVDVNGVGMFDLVADPELGEPQKVDSFMMPSNFEALYGSVATEDQAMANAHENPALALDPDAIFQGAPQHTTPKKVTRASALANSPCAVPVKASLRKGRTPTRSPKKAGENIYQPRIGSPFPIDPLLSASPSPVKGGRGANRTSSTWNPREQTLQQALAEAAEKDGVGGFGKESVVRYAEMVEGRQRQIGKARSGEFKEESVVVAMRWVVV
ncbi:hypothetical protein LTR56_004620 [Elasticomyces elasticus]|nr:hypothetical protein LTR56_004620 [Elasticomyces elasticus]KAK3659861.1 hypothetical protein LTR22_008228 [Elasticomyces elasticus]KAK4925960.1 hypothetical protein LTR49_007098 [Elasticomyces elasticus]KAK5768196.1 hypothetical protein LTS12_001680 [Elasticomyces elasticus]